MASFSLLPTHTHTSGLTRDVCIEIRKKKELSLLWKRSGEMRWDEKARGWVGVSCRRRRFFFKVDKWLWRSSLWRRRRRSLFFLYAAAEKKQQSTWIIISKLLLLPPPHLLLLLQLLRTAAAAGCIIIIIIIMHCLSAHWCWYINQHCTSFLSFSFHLDGSLAAKQKTHQLNSTDCCCASALIGFTGREPGASFAFYTLLLLLLLLLSRQHNRFEQRVLLDVDLV